MKTAFILPAIIRPAIVTAYSEERAVQIERACNGALNDKETVKAAPGKVKWNGQLNGGQSISAKGKFSAKEASWKETEEFVYSVEQSTAPIETVKFCGALTAMYRKCGSGPSAELTLAVVPSYCREWFDAMHAKAKGSKAAVDKINRQTKGTKPAKPTVTPTVKPKQGVETLVEAFEASKAADANGAPA